MAIWEHEELAGATVRLALDNRNDSWGWSSGILTTTERVRVAPGWAEIGERLEKGPGVEFWQRDVPPAQYICHFLKTLRAKTSTQARIQTPPNAGRLGANSKNPPKQA